jgi:hypothetical protein
MNENLELRITKAREFLKDAYSPKERKWYQAKLPEYELISNGIQKKQNQSLKHEEIIIRNDTKGALKMSAFFVLLSLIIFIIFKKDAFGYLIMLSFFIIFGLKIGLDRNPKLILNNNSFWGYNFEKAILWGNVIAIYFKTEELSDSKNYSLMIHYYDEEYDYFKEIEFKLNGYEISNEEIIAAIKHFSYNKKLA